LELSIALALLVVAMMAAWSVIGGARRNERMLWDELTANELATSVLEQTYAGDPPELTPSDGRVVSAPKSATPILPELKITLFVTAVAGRDDLCEVKAHVSWQAEPSAGGPRERVVERSMTLRKGPR
jgi:hypothetical protein